MGVARLSTGFSRAPCARLGSKERNAGLPPTAWASAPREEELLTTMLSRRGANPRLDAHLLALTPTDLRFRESLAPLLGDTPRRVKRFVNVTQPLLACAVARARRQPPAGL
jgi:hypothetical protein